MQNHNITLAVDELEIDMNLEEAKENIGKEVVYFGNDKNLLDDVFKGKKLIISEPTRSREQNVLIEYDDLYFWVINPLHIKLKEQPMQNYKIKVTPETSEEVQRLFFELGYRWTNGHKEVHATNEITFIFVDEDGMFFSEYHKFMAIEYFQEITIPQLRDMVVLKRNDVGDATHIGRSGSQYYRGYMDYLWNGVHWLVTVVNDDAVTPIKKESEMKVKELNKFVNLKSTEMTWQDALRAVADGKDVEVKNISWFDINDLKLGQIKKGKAFRIKPQTIYIDGGDYTKEELLKIVGEMG